MSKKKVLVLGRGFLGSTFERHGHTVYGRDTVDWCETNDEVICKKFGQELTNSDHIIVNTFKKYDAVVNCVAKSDTRWCENPDTFRELMSINALFPKYLSEMCEIAGTQFVQISTGCLYDSRGAGKSAEDDFLSAHCNYVVSKWTAEGYLKPHDLIIRPRLIFDSAPATGRNNLIQKLPQFDQFLDEFNSVTSNDTIVEAVEALIGANQYGVFNVCNRGTYTMYEMAKVLGLSGGKIKQEDLHASQGLFLVNNVMDTTKLEQFYTPRETMEELNRCQRILQETLDSDESV
jgi:dTDP-4-dehydrorhamnose reductase